MEFNRGILLSLGNPPLGEWIRMYVHLPQIKPAYMESVHWLNTLCFTAFFFLLLLFSFLKYGFPHVSVTGFWNWTRKDEVCWKAELLLILILQNLYLWRTIIVHCVAPETVLVRDSAARPPPSTTEIIAMELKKKKQKENQNPQKTPTPKTHTKLFPL